MGFLNCRQIFLWSRNSCILGSPHILLRFHQNPPLDPTLKRFISVYNHAPKLSKVHLSSHLRLGLPSKPLPFIFFDKNRENICMYQGWKWRLKTLEITSLKSYSGTKYTSSIHVHSRIYPWDMGLFVTSKRLAVFRNGTRNLGRPLSVAMGLFHSSTMNILWKHNIGHATDKQYFSILNWSSVVFFFIRIHVMLHVDEILWSMTSWLLLLPQTTYRVLRKSIHGYRGYQKHVDVDVVSRACLSLGKESWLQASISGHTLGGFLLKRLR